MASAHRCAAALLAVAIVRMSTAEVACDQGEGCKADPNTQGSALLQKSLAASSFRDGEGKSTIKRHEAHTVNKELEPPVVDVSLSGFQKQVTKQLIETNTTHLNGVGFDIVKLFSDIIESFKDFESCLGQDPRYSIMTMLEFFTDRLGQDLGSVWNQFSERYLNDAVGSTVEWFGQQVDKGFAKIQTDFLLMTNGAFDLDNFLSAEKISDDINEHMANLNELVSKPGMLPSKCVMDNFVTPNVDKIKEVLLPFLQTIIDLVKGFWNGLTSTLMGWIAPAIVALANSAWGDWDKKVAQLLEKNAASVCMDQISYATKELDENQENVDKLMALVADLNADMTFELTGSVISAAVSAAISELFSWGVDQIVNPGVAIISDALTWITQVVLHFINGLCGLIPEVGAAICASITGSVDAVAKNLQGLLDDTATDLIKKAFDLLSSAKDISGYVVDFLKKAYNGVSREVHGWAAGLGSGLDFWVQAGFNTIAPLLESFVSLAMPATNEALLPCSKARKAFAVKVTAAIEKYQTRMRCEDWCDTHTSPWTDKCAFEDNACAGCQFCQCQRTITDKCAWTQQWGCPGQDPGWSGSAGNDGSLAYKCCCDLGMWQDSEVQCEGTKNTWIPDQWYSTPDNDCKNWWQSSDWGANYDCGQCESGGWGRKECGKLCCSVCGKVTPAPTASPTPPTLAPTPAPTVTCDATSDCPAGFKCESKVCREPTPPPTPAPPTPQAFVIENAPGVGTWGGSCTCPDGQVYQVADNNDGCTSLACIGGTSGECNQQNGPWRGRKVACDGRAYLCPTECHTCKEGVDWEGDTGGDKLVENICTNYCSKYGYCGHSDPYRIGGYDCTRCADYITTTSTTTTAAAKASTTTTTTAAAAKASTTTTKKAAAAAALIATNASISPQFIQIGTRSGIATMSKSYAAVMESSAQRLLNKRPFFNIKPNRSKFRDLAANVTTTTTTTAIEALAQSSRQRVNKSGFVHIDSQCYQGNWKYDEWGYWFVEWHYQYTYKSSQECGWALHKGGFFCSHTETMDKDTFNNIIEGQGWSKCFDDANPLDALAKAAEVGFKIIQQFGEVSQCVDQLTGVDQKWTSAYFWQFFFDRIGDLPRLFDDLTNDYIVASWNVAQQWSDLYLKRHAQKGLDNLDKFVYQGDFEADVPWVKQQMDYAWDLVNNPVNGLFFQPGLGPMKCLAEKVLPTVYQNSKDVIAEFILHVVKPVVEFLPKVMEALKQFIAQTAAAAADSDEWFGEIVSMFREAIQKQCVADIVAGPKSTDLSIDLLSLTMSMIESVMANIQSWIMDVVVEPIARALQKMAEGLTDVIMHTLDGVAGVAPFVGGFIGALVSSAQSSVKTLLQEFNHNSIMSVIGDLFTQVRTWIVTTIKDLHLEQQIDALTQFVMDGPFAPIAEIVMKFIQWSLAAIGGTDLDTCAKSKQALLNR